MLMSGWIIPYRLKNEDCLSYGQAPSQGIVYAINKHVIVKMPFQYLIRDSLEDDVEYRRDCSLQSFAFWRKETAIYNLFRESPHPNIARTVPVLFSNALFLERMIPLRTARSEYVGERNTLYMWICQLLSALSWIERLGVTHGDLAVQNLAIDVHGTLKVFDFGSASHWGDEWFEIEKEKDHSGLATCMHFILSGVDPMTEARSTKEARRIRQRLADGTYDLEPEADRLREAIKAGWMGRRKGVLFEEVRADVEKIIGSRSAGAGTVAHGDARVDVEALRTECLEWMRSVAREPEWMTEKEYRTAWKHLGFENNTNLE